MNITEAAMYLKKKSKIVLDESVVNDSTLVEKALPGDILRDGGIKIKSTHGTKFGTEFVLAKHYDEEQIKTLLSGYDLKFDGNSVFVID